MLTCPVNVCVVSVQTADFNGICSAFARRQSAAQGMGDKRRQKIPRRTAGRELRLVHDRVVEVGETEKKIHFNSFWLKDERKKKKKDIPLYLPSLAFRRTVLATIFSISIVRMWVPSSRDTFHSAEKDGFSDQTCRRRSGCCTRTGRTRHWRIVGV